MLTENYVVEDTTCTEYITDGMRFCTHVFDVDDLGSHVAGSAAAYEQVVGIVCDGGESEIDDDGLFAEDDVVRF
jgi:hypothetical protein